MFYACLSMHSSVQFRCVKQSLGKVEVAHHWLLWLQTTNVYPIPRSNGHLFLQMRWLVAHEHCANSLLVYPRRQSRLFAPQQQCRSVLLGCVLHEPGCQFRLQNKMALIVLSLRTTLLLNFCDSRL